MFDTAFHHTLPAYAYLYGLPYEYYENQITSALSFGSTIQDIPYMGLLVAQPMDVLPNSTPYEIAQFTVWDTGMTAETLVLSAGPAGRGGAGGGVDDGASAVIGGQAIGRVSFPMGSIRASISSAAVW